MTTVLLENVTESSKKESKFVLFLQMIKFEHSIFALPFAFMGLFLAARGIPHLKVLVLVTLAMISLRTTAMGLNRLLDQSIDGLNPRTKNRALPAGALKRSYAWMWTLSCLAVFILSAWALNPLCLKLSAIPIFLSLIYPMMKRWSYLSHWVLGMVLGMAPAGAWIAYSGSLTWLPILLSLGVICWVAGFDILYATQDMEFDQIHGLHSFPAKFGWPASLRMTGWMHLAAVLFWISAGISAALGPVYFIGLAIVALFLIREFILVRSHGMKKLDEAFFTMNAAVSVVFFVFVLADLLIFWRIS